MWPELRATFEEHNFSRIVINTDRDIAFAGGLHVGEYDVLVEELGEGWMGKMVNEPMLAVEYIATRVEGQLPYYRKLQETVWAMLEEGFSHRIVRPGITSTEVRSYACWSVQSLTFCNCDLVGSLVVVQGEDSRTKPHHLESTPYFCPR